MLGYSSYIDKSINGIKTISDGFSTMQNGTITTNTINTGKIDTNHISSDTGQIDTFIINNLTTNSVTCTSLTLNDINTDEFEVLDGIDTSQTIQQQLDNKPSLNTPNVFTDSNTFTDISANDISASNISSSNISANTASAGTALVPFMATINNHITTKTYVDDTIFGMIDAIDTTPYARLASINDFTGDYNKFKFVTTGGLPDPTYFTGNLEKGLNINPHSYTIDGSPSTPVYGGFHLPFTDGNSYFPTDAYFAGIVATSSTPTSNSHLTNKLYVDNEIDTRAGLTDNNTFSGHNTFTDISASDIDASDIGADSVVANTIFANDISASNISASIISTNSLFASGISATTISGSTVNASNTHTTNIDASNGIITNLSDGSSNYITQAYADNKYFIHDGSLEVSKDIINVVQTSDATNNVIISYTAPAGVSNNINAISSLCHVMGFMQPNAVGTDRVVTDPFTVPVVRNSLDYVYTIISSIQVDVYRDGTLFASNITFSSSNATSFSYTHYFQVDVVSLHISPAYDNWHGVNFTFNRPLTTINVSHTNPVDTVSHNYELRVNISRGSNSYVQYVTASDVRINAYYHLQYFADHITVNATNTDYSKYVVVIVGSNVVASSFSGYQNEAVDASRSAPSLSEGLNAYYTPKSYRVGFDGGTYTVTKGVQTKSLTTETITSVSPVYVICNIHVDWKFGLCFRKTILAHVFYDSTGSSFAPLFASTKQLSSIDNDEFWLVEPGVKLVLYTSPNYVGYLGSYENTTYFTAKVNSTSIYPPNQNDCSSVRCFYQGQQIIISPFS